jgi:ABC-type enterobactin transport system permease subunit
MSQAGPISDSTARAGAPASGARNAYAFVSKTDPTWRESLVGSLFLLGAFGLGAALAIAGAVLRQRHTRRALSSPSG